MSNQSYAQDVNTKVLVIYSNNVEFTYLQNKLLDVSSLLTITSARFDQLSARNFSNYDMLVIASSTEISIEEVDELKIHSFASNPSKALLVMSPYVKDFEDNLEHILGIENSDDVVPEDESKVSWNLTLTSNLGNHSVGENFNYLGKIARVSPTSTSRVIAQITETNSTDEDILDIDLPTPIILNATTNKALILTSLLSPLQSSNLKTSLGLSQLPSLFDSLLTELISTTLTSLNFRQIVNSSIGQTDSQTTNSSQVIETGSDSSVLPDQFKNPFYIVVVMILAFLMIFFRQFFGFLRWFSEKILGFAVLTIGAFYNIQDRILDHNDVLLNQSRADIVDYLEYLGSTGAHLREIKSILNMGSGSLLWHLQVLEDFGWISKYKINNYTVFVAEDFTKNFDPSLKSLELKLQSKYLLPILELLVDLDEDTQLDVPSIENLTGINRKAIRRQLVKMVETELIELNDEKQIKVNLDKQEKLNAIFQSLWKRKEYSRIESTITVNSSTEHFS
jgi:predicted transcriptional regulator